MIEVEIQIPVRLKQNAVQEIVERICCAESLTVTLKSTLAQYPGCVHWHLKRGKERGVLEITYWESENRLWFKVASGRTGDWIEEIIPRLKTQVESSLFLTSRVS